LAFVQMIIGGGAAGGVRVFPEVSARLMTTDHLSQAQRAASTAFLGSGVGWGFGLMVPAAARPSAEGLRLIGWDGGHRRDMANRHRPGPDHHSVHPAFDDLS
jgi:CubicO group peptidase (beta-lactamase class C family)